MFKNIALFTLVGLLFAGSTNVLACDACGCGVGSYQFGILPQQTKNFVGIRYQTKSDESTPHHDLQTKEQFQTMEVWGRFYPLKRVQVLALVPFNYNQQKVGNTVTEVKGLGDALVLVNYNLLNNADSLYQPVKHNLFVGGGLKLPTGYAQAKTEGSEINPNLQLGSGSLDLIANLMYTVRYNRIGLNTNLTYKHNSTNQNEFRFGNKLGAGGVVFSVVNIKEFALMPNAGFSTEITEKDVHFKQELKESGGRINFLTVGTEFYFKNLSAGVTAQKPLSQHVSEGYVKTNNRFLTHLTFMF